MTGKKGERLCPICDSPLEPGAKKCSFCGTDLSIFDTEPEVPKEVPKEEPKVEPPEPSEVAEEPAESKLDEVFFGADEEAPTAEAPPAEPEVEEAEAPEPVKPIPEPVVDEPEGEAVEPSPTPEIEPEAAEQPTEAEAPAAEEHFECPECGGKVKVSAKSCPGCGVIFADEGADMFQCPACNTLVDVNAKSCPGCGAIFVESEEEAAQEPQPVAPVMPSPTPTAQAKVELEKPVSEVVLEPDEESSEEAAMEEPESKGLLGGLFGRKKRKKREPEEAEAEERKLEFPSILRRARPEAEKPETVDEDEASVESAQSEGVDAHFLQGLHQESIDFAVKGHGENFHGFLIGVSGGVSGRGGDELGRVANGFAEQIGFIGAAVDEDNFFALGNQCGYVFADGIKLDAFCAAEFDDNNFTHVMVLLFLIVRYARP